MNCVFLLFVIFLTEIRSDWRLVWSDEFDAEQIDQDNWEIDEMDANKCDPQAIRRLNCFTNRTRNLRLIDGSLALTAVPEKYKTKKYTSAFIKTRKSLTFGKIEIRAALPIGKLLSPWIKLVPIKAKSKDGFVQNNQVIVFFNDQTNNIRYSLSLGRNLPDKSENSGELITNGDLDQFNTYSIEWNDSEVIWSFNQMESFYWNNKNRNQTFLNGPVILTIYLRVGGQPFSNGAITAEEANEWDCSALIIDYVRYYQWTNDTYSESNLAQSTNSAQQTCKTVMSDIRPEMVSSGSNIIIICVISAVCLVLIFIIIPLIVWLVIWMTKMKKTDKRLSENENYDDVNQMTDLYEDCENTNRFEYDNTYQVMKETTISDSSYADVQPVHYTPGPILLAKILLDNSSNNNIMMTKSNGKEHHDISDYLVMTKSGLKP